jgi:mono/diheme cytochrome c family protein
MKINPAVFFYFVLFSSSSFPAFAKAQTNHCAVRKSPFRVSMDSGKVIYTRQCLACHQADGLGAPGMNPPLDGKDVSGDKGKLIEIVIKGLATHQEIDGNKYQNVMPPHPEMTDTDIADVLTYIRNSFGNKASSVKAPEVKSVRNKLK